MSVLVTLAAVTLAGCGGGSHTVTGLTAAQRAELARLAVENLRPVCKPGEALLSIEHQQPIRRISEKCVSAHVAAEVERLVLPAQKSGGG